MRIVISKDRTYLPEEGEKIVDLTERELDVIRLVADGETNPSIGFKLGISDQTVKSHITLIFAKLNLDNRVKLARFYWEMTEPRGT